MSISKTVSTDTVSRLTYRGGAVIVSGANLENQITDRAVPKASRAMGRAGSTVAPFRYFIFSRFA
jgi:hypothetical protein